MKIRYVTIGIHYQEDVPDFRILTVDAHTEQDALEIVEALGNVEGTTTAWTDERFVELAAECSSDRADFVQADEEHESCPCDSAEPERCPDVGAEEGQ
jgi:hypothetical protein